MSIITRAQWGALPQAVLVPTPMDWSGEAAVVHHTASARMEATADPRVEAGAMRAIDRQHFYANGWSGGIGYHYVIFPSGRIYEGRGFMMVGAHAPRWNHNPGIALYGNFMAEPPTINARLALADLAASLEVTSFIAHRNVYPTACPGDVLANLLPGISIGRRILREQSPPHGRTLRMVIDDGAIEGAGWDACTPLIRRVAASGLNPRKRHSIAWRGTVWRGAADVTNVCKNLNSRFLEG